MHHDTACPKTHVVALKAERTKFGASGSELLHAGLGYVSPGWTLKGPDLYPTSGYLLSYSSQPLYLLVTVLVKYAMNSFDMVVKSGMQSRLHSHAPKDHEHNL
jgi:hypothetical protein